MEKIKSFLTRIEDSKINFGLWISTALGIITIRIFQENVLLGFLRIEWLNFHYLISLSLFFLSLFLAIIVVLHLFSQEEIIKVSKATLCFFWIILLPVIIDCLVGIASGERIYHYSYVEENLKGNFINFFNPLVKISGIPYGIRIEISLVTLLAFFYLFLKINRIFLSLIGALVVFTTCFFYISFPGILVRVLKFLTSFIPIFKADYAIISNHLVTDFADLVPRLIIIAMLVLTLLVSAIWFWSYDRSKALALLRNLRISRSLHYMLWVITGAVFNFAYFSGVAAAEFTLIKLLGALLAIFYAFQFSVVINDIFDVDCDSISSPDRPLVAGVFSKEEYLRVGMVYLAFALLFAFIVSNAAFRITLVFITLYFIYSAPPLKLKRFFILSSLVIAIQAILAFLLGVYIFLAHPISQLGALTDILGMIFWVFLLSSPVKDLKDIEGDRASGVYTLPVILGETKARRIIGVLVCISYLIVPFFLARMLDFIFSFFLFFLSLVFGLFNYDYIKRNDAKERVIFLSYFIYMFFVLIFLIVRIP